MKAARPAFREQLDALRDAGGARFDPLRFRYLESLTARLANSRHPQHRQRLQQALDRFRRRLDEPGHQDARREQHAEPVLSPLARLLADWPQGEQSERSDAGFAPEPLTPEQVTSLKGNLLATLLRQQQASLGLLPPENQARPLKAARHLRHRSARLHSESGLRRAFAGAPDNAGPLNAHRLVNQALQQIRDISPEYLHHLARHLEVLMALENVTRR